MIPRSQLGYGCYALGGAYGKKVTLNQTKKLIHLAYALGLRYFDTAAAYGTEEVLGEAVKSFRHEITIATKIGFATSGKTTLSKAHILDSCEASLQRLQTNYIDLYQVHYDDPHTPVPEVVATLELLQQQGKIRGYGVCHLPLTKTTKYLEQGQPHTVLAEISPVALNRYRELHPLQRDHDFGIIAFSVTGRGLLTGKISSRPQFGPGDIRKIDPLFQRARLTSGLRIQAKLKEIGQDYSATPTQMAIAWVLSQPGITAALTGPTNPEHLRENCGALSIPGGWQKEFHHFLQTEHQHLQKIIAQEIRSLVANPQATGKDLLYVLEHCLEAELIPYLDGVAIFEQLIPNLNSPKNCTKVRLQLQNLLT